ncbi:hypothetical protein [Lysobacter sp. F6437]|uniref:hypothetical protein n=1 Tax=Lysobacter sp. F6437 TaxID=3459296 RepID=UPI00403DCB1E
MSMPTPTADPLPYFVRGANDDFSRDGQPGDNAQTRASVKLKGEAIARFDALLHEIHPDAARVDPDRLQHLMSWLLSLPATRAHDVLDRRLRRLEGLRAMLDDSDWDTSDAIRARVLKLLDYVDRDDDLIADHEPMLGLLDDVLLIELAWPAFSAEAEEYRDFCTYRDDEHPVGSGESQRHAWVRDRLAEIALWQHHARVNDSQYAHSGDPPLLFRVG